MAQTIVRRRTRQEYAGFVKNVQTGRYDMLFCTEFSGLLAYGRAKEKARMNNEYNAEAMHVAQLYDPDDIIIKERTVEYTETYHEWELVPAV